MWLIIDRMLVREVTQVLLAVVGILLVIVVGHRFVRYLAEAAAGGISSDIILALLSLKSLSYSALVIPPAFFFAILIALGRMYRDNEMLVLAVNSIGTLRVYRTLLLLALPIAGMVGLLTLQVVPWAMDLGERIREQQEQQVHIKGIQPGRFNEYSQGDLVFYVESFSSDHKEMRNIFVQHRKHGKLELVSAERGYQYLDDKTGDQFIVLVDGYRYQGNPGEASFRLVKFEKYGVLVNRNSADVLPSKLRAMPTKVLWNSPERSNIAALQWRISVPLSIIVLVFLAVPMSTTSPGEGNYIKLFVAVPLYFVYANLQSIARAWLEKGYIPTWLGIWWVHVGLLLVAGSLLFWQSKSRWPT